MALLFSLNPVSNINIGSAQMGMSDPQGLFDSFVTPFWTLLNPPF